MKFYNIEQAAAELKIRNEGVLALCQSGFFGRKIGNTWLITKQEIVHYQAGSRADPDSQPKLYDADHVIKDLKISRSRFYRLVAAGTIEGHEFGNRGGNPNLVFTEGQLKAARAAVVGMSGAGKRHVDADKHIEERNGRFYILGTYSDDPEGLERNYKSRTIARQKAREAYGQEPTYRKGDTFPYGEGSQITVLKDVTPIDGLAHIQIGKATLLWPVRQLITYEEGLHEKELVTVYKDGLWPEGESDDTDKETRSE